MLFLQEAAAAVSHVDSFYISQDNSRREFQYISNCQETGCLVVRPEKFEEEIQDILLENTKYFSASFISYKNDERQIEQVGRKELPVPEMFTLIVDGQTC